jgi:EmrB/QacA subfamily drug resistance transporter
MVDAPEREIGLLRDRRIAGVILAASFALFLIQLDFFAAQAALPDMADDLDTTVATLQWVISGYMLTLSSCFIVGGRLADIFGRRRWFLIGTVIFAVTSLLGGMSVNAGMVIGMRILQGLGGAIMFPVSVALVTNAVPQRRVQRAVGLTLGIGAIGQALGPVIGGALTELVSWRWVLWVNVPVAVAMIALTLLAVEESRDDTVPRQIDWAGLALVVVSVGSFTYGVDRSADWGWASAATLAFIAAGVIGLAALLVVERRVEFPLIDLSLFRIREFSVMAAGGTVANIPIVAAIFLSMIYLQDVLGFTALEAGTAFVAFSGGVMLSFQSSGSMDRFPSGAVAGIALAVGGLGTIGMGVADTLVPFLVCSAFSGFGLGLAIALANTVTQSVVPPEQAGEASGIVLTTTVGLGAVGVAAAASAITPDVGGATATLESTLDALLIAYGALALAFAPVVALLSRTPADVGEAPAGSASAA